MISQARLRVLAREKGLRLDVVEKDYVNSWVLHAIFTGGLKKVLAFKGGTALSKLYFPKVWRFSEDLDFTAQKPISQQMLEDSLQETFTLSGIAFNLKSFFPNPGYIQAKIQYDAVLGHKNTTSLDISLQEPILFPSQEINHQFEDIPSFSIKAYAIEEIFMEKLRSLFQRARARDYYDLFFLLEHHTFDDKQILEALIAKCKAKEIACSLSQFPDQENVAGIRGYWENSLERLTTTRPPFDQVLQRIESYIRRLEEM